MGDQKDIAIVNEERSIADVSSQVKKIQELMSAVMKKDEHYGIIPGTGKKPSLLKPGAEKLCFVFRLAPEFELDRDDFPNGHREYRVKCRLRSMATGNIVGEGLGSCSTMEAKYRYRNASDYEVTDQPIPRDAKERKAEYRKQGFGMKKVDGEWLWVRYTSESRVENPDIADVYNTVLKMAKKRAHVDATITACAASDIFTQDVEDLQSEDEHDEPPIRNVTPASSRPASRPVQTNAAPASLSIDEQWRAAMAELGKVLTASVGAVPAFSEEDKADYQARVKSLPQPRTVEALQDIVLNAQAALDALRSRWEEAGSPTPRPDDIDAYIAQASSQKAAPAKSAKPKPAPVHEPESEPEPEYAMAGGDEQSDVLDIF